MDSLIRAGGSRGGLDEAALDRLEAVGVSEGDTEALFRRTLMTTLEVVPCEHSLLLARNDDGSVRLYTALDDDALIGMPFTESDSILGAALRSVHPITLDRVAERDDSGEILTRMFRARQLMLIPLRHDGETVGVLGAVDPLEGGFNEAVRIVLMLLSARTAVAMSALRNQERLRSEVVDADRAGPEASGGDGSKNELLSVVSHEVKGPITNIVGFGQVLRDGWSGVPDEKRTRFLDVIVKEGERAARLLEDALDLARLETGSLRCELSPVAIGGVVRDVLVANETGCANHHIVVELDPDLPAASADPDRLGQVVRNLLSNACRYAPEGTRVTIRALRIRSEDDASILVSVTDEGPGIPLGEQAALFEKFTRLSTANGGGKGSGLGLYISRGIVEAHGGRIWVKSQPGEGTTFFFTLRPA